MPKLSHVCLAAGLAAAAGLAGVPATAAAAQADENAPQEDAMPATPADPYLWLEDVTGHKQMAWVRATHARTQTDMDGPPGFHKPKSAILPALASDHTLPHLRTPGH